MGAGPIKVLLVEDNLADVRLLREALADAHPAELELALAHVHRLTEALRCLGTEPFDVLLLDLALPDSQGLETYLKVHRQAPDVPIVVLTGLNDNALALKAVREGAQDYLVKGQYDGALLVRSLRYAIERHRMQTALRSLSLMDELTGLYNRRGFLALAEQHVKLACRTRKDLLLVFVDVDNLKRINDTLGHQKGDQVLIEAARILRETFRDSDILARLGGDEFVALAFASSHDHRETIIRRLHETLAAHNTPAGWPLLSLSTGVARFDPHNPVSLEQLMVQADAAMYKQKRSRREG